MKAKMPLDIKRFENKFVGGLTVRQFIFAAITAILFAVILICLYNVVAFEILSLLACIIISPVLMIGFINVGGLTFEQIVVIMWRDTMYNENYRPYKIEKD